jgi:PKD repeat protein
MSLFVILGLAAVVVAGVLFLVFRSRPNLKPIAEFTAAPSDTKPLEIVFDASRSRDPDGEVRHYVWDFGDGQTGTGITTQYTYAAAGKFTATLTVTDNRGEPTSSSQEVVVHKLPVPRRWESVSQPATSYPPLFTQIEPPDGAVVCGTEAWVRWSPSGQAEGRILWHKAGEAEVRVSAATGTDPLLVRLQPLISGEKYEYVIEQSSGDFVQRSGLRAFTVECRLGFDPPVVEQTIQREHDQTVTLTVRNDSQEAVTVAAQAVQQFDDLPADIVGPGSVDDPIDLEPGKKHALRLAVFAADATRHTYEIPVQAGGAFGTALVKVGIPQLKLSFRVIAEDPRTLAKTIELRNDGETQTDLALRIVPPHDTEIRLEPVANHAYLLAGGTMQFIATPVLYLEFESLKTAIEATAASQSTQFPLEFQAPPGKQLMGVRTATSGRTSAGETYCNPIKCTDMPGPPGNGPAMSPQGEDRDDGNAGGSKRTGVIGDESEARHMLASNMLEPWPGPNLEP